MKCLGCGVESGRYSFCKECYQKKQQGLLLKCTKCGKWHMKDVPCPTEDPAPAYEGNFLYQVKPKLMSPIEELYFRTLQGCVPEGFLVFPQMNLAAIVEKTDHSAFRNELFRNLDFLITDGNFVPKLAVEINDLSHLKQKRVERDERVSHILEEAGLPLLTLWTSDSLEENQLKQTIVELLQKPVQRKHYASEKSGGKAEAKKSEKGCYIATCVYGSYDCPKVWVLRRFRDEFLDRYILGRLFIKCYYAISPGLVKRFGHSERFRQFWEHRLDRLVRRLCDRGVADTRYEDRY